MTKTIQQNHVKKMSAQFKQDVQESVASNLIQKDVANYAFKTILEEPELCKYTINKAGDDVNFDSHGSMLFAGFKVVTQNEIETLTIESQQDALDKFGVHMHAQYEDFSVHSAFQEDTHDVSDEIVCYYTLYIVPNAPIQVTPNA